MWVLDASVAVKWFFLDEPLHDHALSVRLRLINCPEDFVVPPLFYSEFLHVLARKSAKDLNFVQQPVFLICQLGIRTISLSENGLTQATRLVCDGFSGYDATYLALAHELKILWLTPDSQAIKKSGDRYAINLSNFS